VYRNITWKLSNQQLFVIAMLATIVSTACQKGYPQSISRCAGRDRYCAAHPRREWQYHC